MDYQKAIKKAQTEIKLYESVIELSDQVIEFLKVFDGKKVFTATGTTKKVREYLDSIDKNISLIAWFNSLEIYLCTCKCSEGKICFGSVCIKNGYHPEDNGIIDDKLNARPLIDAIIKANQFKREKIQKLEYLIENYSELKTQYDFLLKELKEVSDKIEEFNEKFVPYDFAEIFGLGR